MGDDPLAPGRMDAVLEVQSKMKDYEWVDLALEGDSVKIDLYHTTRALCNIVKRQFAYIDDIQEQVCELQDKLSDALDKLEGE